MTAKQAACPTPAKIMDYFWGIASTHVLVTAIELDLFSLINDGNHTVASIVRVTGFSSRGLRMLLDALTGMQLLTKHRSEYSLTPDSEMFLVASSPSYLGSTIKQGGQAGKIWTSLTQMVRTDKPPVQIPQEHFQKFLPQLARALFPISYWAAQAFYATLSEEEQSAFENVLDVAAGSGAWSLPLAQRSRAVRVTAIDFAVVLKVAQEFAERLGVADQYQMLPLNIREGSLGIDDYDLVILGNICHSEGEQNIKSLLEKSYRALRTGGRLLIADVVPNNERTGPLVPLLFALNMLINTTNGDAFTFAQFSNWLRRTGFTRVKAIDAGTGSPLILAQK